MVKETRKLILFQNYLDFRDFFLTICVVPLWNTCQKKTILCSQNGNKNVVHQRSVEPEAPKPTAHYVRGTVNL